MYLCSLICCLVIILLETLEASIQTNNASHLTLYEEVLDAKECEKQLFYIRTNDSTLLFRFIDVGPRTPRGMFLGNFKDMGSYYDCLSINEQAQDMSIEGKYCMMDIPIKQEDLKLPEMRQEFAWPNLPMRQIVNPLKMFGEKMLIDLQTFEFRKRSIQTLLGQSKDVTERTVSRIAEGSELAGLSFELAFCIPKVCTVKQALDILTFNVTDGLEVNEAFCRLPNDKPWIAGDYFAITIFAIIAILTILSTSYDILHAIFFKRDPNEANKMYILFSVYTNTRKFFTFKSNANTINCLDGIRSFAMLWVIIGHTFVIQINYILWNPLAVSEFLPAFSSLWITSATITVDTFFMISGLLVVYTTASKMSRMWLVKNLHLFYLNRFLRMFPVLAATILFQVSFMNWMTDGPLWNIIAQNTNNCQKNWWVTLLYLQNFVKAETICLPHTWYLAIDMHMYLISPMVLFWVVGGSKRSAWLALGGAFIAVITASTIYNFMKAFPAMPLSLLQEKLMNENYIYEYYFHTLTRASPFFVGMIFGYILHLYRGKRVHIPKIVNIILWLLAMAVSSTVIISTYFVIQPDWTNQTVNNLLNSFMRPAWAACVAWMVFACHHGYGGPINWVLSLYIFKILGRLSYAMYIVHFNLIFLHNSTELAPIYFSVENSLRRFQVDLNLAVIAAFVLIIFIDAPFSALIGIILGDTKKGNKSETKEKKNDLTYIKTSKKEIPPKTN